MRATPVKLLCLLWVGLALALTVNLSKAALAQGVPMMAFALWPLLGSGLLLLLVAALSGNSARLSRQTLTYGFWSGTLGIALPYAISFTLVPKLGAGLVTLVYALPPVITYAMALLVGLEKPRLRRGIGIGFGLMGAVLLGRGDRSLDLLGVLLLLSPIAIAAGNIYRTLRWPQGASPLSLAPLMVLGAAVPLAPFALLAGDAAVLHMVTPLGWSMIAAQALLTCLLYIGYFILQKLAGPVYLSQIGYVAAAAGLLLALLWHGETPALSALLALGLIFTGVLLVRPSPASA
jgi:drug/metabolite transporter (DMT)-like permease